MLVVPVVDLRECSCMTTTIPLLVLPWRRVYQTTSGHHYRLQWVHCFFCLPFFSCHFQCLHRFSWVDIIKLKQLLAPFISLGTTRSVRPFLGGCCLLSVGFNFLLSRSTPVLVPLFGSFCNKDYQPSLRTTKIHTSFTSVASFFPSTLSLPLFFSSPPFTFSCPCALERVSIASQR